MFRFLQIRPTSVLNFFDHFDGEGCQECFPSDNGSKARKEPKIHEQKRYTPLLVAIMCCFVILEDMYVLWKTLIHILKYEVYILVLI